MTKSIFARLSWKQRTFWTLGLAVVILGLSAILPFSAACGPAADCAAGNYYGWPFTFYVSNPGVYQQFYLLNFILSLAFYWLAAILALYFTGLIYAAAFKAKKS